MLAGSALGSLALGSGQAGTAAGWYFRIGGKEVTDLVAFDDAMITQELNGRDRADLTLFSNDASYRPALGASVEISYGNAVLFAGTVEDREEKLIVEYNLIFRTFRLACVDYNQLADRKIAVEVFENMTAGDMVEALMLKYLTLDGVTGGSIVDGPIVLKGVFPYLRVSDCFDELAAIAGHVWHIDYYKRLNFHPRTESIAPFVITQGNAVFRQIRTRLSRDQYRNVQIVRGGQDFTATRVEQFVGDGKRRTFNVEFPVGLEPAISVGGNPQTIGISGVDDGKQWYWQKSHHEINQDDGETVLTPSNTLFVTYKGLVQVIARKELGAEIAARAAVEGGEGRYEAVEDHVNLDGADVVGAKLDALLERYGTTDTIVQFETDTDRLAPGQLVTLDVGALALTGTFLVTRVTLRPLSGTTKRRYAVEVSSGEVRGSAREFWNFVAAARRSYVIRENEIAAPSVGIGDQAAVADELTAASESFATWEWGPSIWGEDEWGA